MDTKTKPETAAIDRLFLELSQFTNARTAAEVQRDEQISFIRGLSLELSYQIEKLPASEQQTSISIMAADITRRLNDLLP